MALNLLFWEWKIAELTDARNAIKLLIRETQIGWFSDESRSGMPRFSGYSSISRRSPFHKIFFWKPRIHRRKKRNTHHHRNHRPADFQGCQNVIETLSNFSSLLDLFSRLATLLWSNSESWAAAVATLGVSLLLYSSRSRCCRIWWKSSSCVRTLELSRMEGKIKAASANVIDRGRLKEKNS